MHFDNGQVSRSQVKIRKKDGCQVMRVLGDVLKTQRRDLETEALFFGPRSRLRSARTPSPPVSLLPRG